MELLELEADIRKEKGKGPARSLRREGLIPAILYGPDTKPVSLSINAKELERAIKKSKTRQLLVNLAIKGDEKPSRAVVLKELQRQPLSMDYRHVDFYEVAMDRKIKSMVPVRTTGKSIGLEMGGMLQVIRRELEIKCFPMEIPEAIVIDVTDLDIGNSVHVNDIDLDGDIEIVADVNFTVLTLVAAKTEVEEVEEGEELEEGEEVDGETAEGEKDQAGE